MEGPAPDLHAATHSGGSVAASLTCRPQTGLVARFCRKRIRAGNWRCNRKLRFLNVFSRPRPLTSQEPGEYNPA